MPSANIVTKVVSFADSGVVGIASGEMVRFSLANMGESPIHILAGRFLDTEGETLSQHLERRAVCRAGAVGRQTCNSWDMRALSRSRTLPCISSMLPHGSFASVFVQSNLSADSPNA